MSAEKCEVIQDLLPLYIDNICSDESRRMVSEHLESCNECKKLYENISDPAERALSDPELDSRQAFKAINRKWRIKKISIMCVSIMLTAIAMFTGYMVVQNVSSVHDYFSPITYAYANLRDLSDDRWYQVNFGNADVLVFDSVFYNKKVTLDANSDGAVSVRIRDNNGAIILDERTLRPGTSLDLDMLKRNVEYIVEIKGNGEFILLRFY